MQRALSAFSAVTLVMLFSLSAYPATSKTTLPTHKIKLAAPTNAERAKAFTYVVENTNSMSQLQLLAAVGGEKAEAIRALKKEVTEQTGGDAFPAIRIANNELMVNGEPSGLKIDPSNPGRVRFQNRTWLYDKAKTVDRNYLSLVKFVDTGASTPSFSFIPSAQAAVSTTAKVGAAVFVVGVVVATGGAALFPLTIGAVLGGIGMGTVVLGTPAAMLITSEKVAAKEVRKILDQLAAAKEISLKCDKQEAMLMLTMLDGRKLRVQFSQSMVRKDGNHQYARIYDEEDGHVRAVADFFGSGPFYNEMLKCTTDEQAKAITTQMAAHIEEVRKANEAQNVRSGATPTERTEEEYYPGKDVVHPPADDVPPANADTSR